MIFSTLKSTRPQRSRKGLFLGLFAIACIILMIALVFFLDLNKKAPPPAILNTQAQAHIPIQDWTTAKGMPALLVSTYALPMIDIQLIFDAGSARDGMVSGLAQLTSQVLTQGSADYDAQTIASRIDNVGAHLDVSVNRDTTSINFRSLSQADAFEPAFTTLLSLLAAPTFPPDAVVREQQRLLASLREQEQLPHVIAAKAFYAAVYTDHPYAQAIMGRSETVSLISQEDLQAFANTHYNAQNAVLAIVGNIGLEEAKALAARIENALPDNLPLEDLPAPTASETSSALTIPFSSTQTHILYGGLAIRRDDPDFFPLFLGNHILGGSGLVSILFDEVRKERGLAYSASSQLSPLRQTGTFVMSAQTRNEAADEAIAVMKQTLTNFVANGPTEEQLHDAQSHLTGNFALRLNSNAALVEALGMMAFYGLPLDYLATYRAHILSVSPIQVRDALQKHLPLKNATLVTVGEKRPSVK